MVNEMLWRFWEFLQTGGGIMWPLLAVSVWMWWLILGKLAFFYRQRRALLPWASCRDNLLRHQPVGAVWQRTLLQTALKWHIQPRQDYSAALNKTARELERNVNAGVQTILVLAGVAPLLGLFGTVEGMVDTFTVLAHAGSGGTSPMAGSISEALLSTQAGLLVSVPGLVLGAFLQRRAEGTRRRIRHLALQLSREQAALFHTKHKDPGEPEGRQHGLR